MIKAFCLLFVFFSAAAGLGGLIGMLLSEMITDILGSCNNPTETT